MILIMTRLLPTAVLAFLLGCGSTTQSSNDGGGTGGSSGAAGRGGSSGAGGTSATAGGGGRGGSGATAGGSGRGGSGGGAGTTACTQATAVDRSCSTDGDCVAVVHETSCCGGLAWIGVRKSAQQTFMTLEAQCQASYPGCGCFDGTDGADDGSRIPSGGTAAVTCQAATCKTYALACGHFCPSGSSCQTCTDLTTNTMTSTCAPQCNDATMCTDASAPRCNHGYSIGLCAPAAAPCEMPN